MNHLGNNQVIYYMSWNFVSKHSQVTTWLWKNNRSIRLRSNRLSKLLYSCKASNWVESSECPSGKSFWFASHKVERESFVGEVSVLSLSSPFFPPPSTPDGGWLIASPTFYQLVRSREPSGFGVPGSQLLSGQRCIPKGLNSPSSSPSSRATDGREELDLISEIL